MTYSINLAHFTTLPFANLDDEDLMNGIPRPPEKEYEVMTEASYHLAKAEFALSQRLHILVYPC